MPSLCKPSLTLHRPVLLWFCISIRRQKGSQLVHGLFCICRSGHQNPRRLSKRAHLKLGYWRLPGRGSFQGMSQFRLFAIIAPRAALGVGWGPAWWKDSRHGLCKGNTNRWDGRRAERGSDAKSASLTGRQNSAYSSKYMSSEPLDAQGGGAKTTLVRSYGRQYRANILESNLP